MKVNNVNNQTSFTSRRSIAKMLKVPGFDPKIEFVNKMTGSLVKDIYKSEQKGALNIVLENKKALNKFQKKLGENLLVNPKVEGSIKDETIKLPIKKVIDLLDIVSENSKKPISKLIPKIDKDPALSKMLDDVKMLQVVDAEPKVTFMSIYKLISGVQTEKKPILVPLRKAVENTHESLDELLKPTKKELTIQLENMDKDGLASLTHNIKKLQAVLKSLKNGEDSTKITEQIRDLMMQFKK